MSFLGHRHTTEAKAKISAASRRGPLALTGSELNRRYRKNSPEKYKAVWARYKATVRYRRRSADGDRRRVYGISPEQYDALVLRSAGFCELCARQSERSGNMELVLDHDHATNRLRGLLCSPCNRVLGVIEKHGFTTQWMEQAKRYIGR